MELSEIIQSDADRLFMVDHECFIIFTGDTVEDDKPFIRVGNWINLPVEIIPLIENIIITDRVAGNPSLEQFNIDITHLPGNRYIGSRVAVKKFLDYQRLFGLDLTNAHIVEVERDIPEVSHEKIISNRDSFIGIFYTNGNFRVTHRRHSIFDLLDLDESCPGEAGIHDELSKNNREAKRYAGCGMVLLENNPVFFKNGFFTAYHFPRSYYDDFDRLSIDPAGVRDILLPSSNPINLTRLMKWKQASSGRLRIFSDSRDAMDTLQRLYSGATLVRQNFRGLDFDTGNGLNLYNYPSTYNIRLRFSRTPPSGSDLNLAYIKGTAGIPDIVRDGLDGILVGYPLFEETSLLVRNAGVPVLVLAAGGLTPSRLGGNGVTVLYPGIQYEFMKCDSFTDLLGRIAAAISSADMRALLADPAEEGIREALKDDSLSRQDRCNFTAGLKALRHSTGDRRLSAALKKILADADDLKNPLEDADARTRFRINLAFCGGAAFQYLEQVGDSPAPCRFRELDKEPDAEWIDALADSRYRSYYERIRHDRERLAALLALFAPQSARYGEMSTLKRAIEKKKEDYRRDNSLPAEAAAEEKPGGMKKKLMAGAALLVILALLGAGAYLGVKSLREYRAERVKAVERKARQDLIDKYSIRVRDVDIFHYVNKTAVLNGYSPLSFRDMRRKNPHWIYPGNIFTMPDGETITVKEGDTLWDISHHRLMEINIRFYRALERAKNGGKNGPLSTGEIEQLEKLAFTDEHKNTLAEILNRKKK
ncbi:MAG TPA: hypothetical protein ENN21_07330 [Spirochaetes bacterium]|nr:hypothetical protein [Spirochaetota bacterium]